MCDDKERKVVLLGFTELFAIRFPYQQFPPMFLEPVRVSK